MRKRHSSPGIKPSQFTSSFLIPRSSVEQLQIQLLNHRVQRRISLPQQLLRLTTHLLLTESLRRIGDWHRGRLRTAHEQLHRSIECCSNCGQDFRSVRLDRLLEDLVGLLELKSDGSLPRDSHRKSVLQRGHEHWASDPTNAIDHFAPSLAKGVELECRALRLRRWWRSICERSGDLRDRSASRGGARRIRGLFLRRERRLSRAAAFANSSKQILELNRAIEQCESHQQRLQ